MENVHIMHAIKALLLLRGKTQEDSKPLKMLKSILVQGILLRFKISVSTALEYLITVKCFSVVVPPCLFQRTYSVTSTVCNYL